MSSSASSSSSSSLTVSTQSKTPDMILTNKYKTGIVDASKYVPKKKTYAWPHCFMYDVRNIVMRNAACAMVDTVSKLNLMLEEHSFMTVPNLIDVEIDTSIDICRVLSSHLLYLLTCSPRQLADLVTISCDHKYSNTALVKTVDHIIDYLLCIIWNQDNHIPLQGVHFGAFKTDKIVYTRDINTCVDGYNPQPGVSYHIPHNFRYRVRTIINDRSYTYMTNVITKISLIFNEHCMLMKDSTTVEKDKDHIKHIAAYLSWMMDKQPDGIHTLTKIAKDLRGSTYQVDGNNIVANVIQDLSVYVIKLMKEQDADADTADLVLVD